LRNGDAIRTPRRVLTASGAKMVAMPSPVSRREALGLLGSAAAAAAAAVAFGVDPASARVRTAPRGPQASCVLMPEMTDGPFYLDDAAVRRDITEGKPGVPLRLRLTVVDADSCRPIPRASVEVWHADASGNYSGFGSSTPDSMFLRGAQRANGNGVVRFRTIYPGWYPGRAVHIHLKAHRSGNTVHTTQLFFDESVSDAVYRTSPYRSRSGAYTLNDDDSIYAGGGADSTLRLRRDGSGYVGALTMGIRG
jgi:protocatechuate 3,4-dioxygenase beta subunit